jgi:hypothetical protein
MALTTYSRQAMKLCDIRHKVTASRYQPPDRYRVPSIEGGDATQTDAGGWA